MSTIVTIITIAVILKIITAKIKPKKKRRNHYPRKTRPKPRTTSTNTTYAEKKEKGDNFEKFTSDYYRTLGYEVIEHGKQYGNKDMGIDIIAHKENESILIQCKNHNANTKWKIRQKDIKAFRMDCIDYTRKNKHNLKENIKGIFIVSDIDSVHYGALRYIEDKKSEGRKIDIKELPF